MTDIPTGDAGAVSRAVVPFNMAASPRFTAVDTRRLLGLVAGPGLVTPAVPRPTFSVPGLAITEMFKLSSHHYVKPSWWSTVAEMLGQPTEAAAAAEQATTVAEFAAALDALRKELGLSYGALAAGHHEFTKTTAYRACKGETFFQRREQVSEFVKACGVERETDTWLQAWAKVRAAKKDRRSARSEHRAPAADQEALVLASGADPEADGAPRRRSGLQLVQPDLSTAGDPTDGEGAGAEPDPDDVAATLTIPITYRHLEMVSGISAGVTVGTMAALAAGRVNPNTAVLVMAIAMVSTGLLHEWVRANSINTNGADTGQAQAG